MRCFDGAQHDTALNMLLNKTVSIRDDVMLSSVEASLNY